MKLLKDYVNAISILGFDEDQLIFISKENLKKIKKIIKAEMVGGISYKSIKGREDNGLLCSVKY